MTRIIAQPCLVIGAAEVANEFADELALRGVRFVSAAPSVGQLRRHLVLGEDASIVLCVLLGVHELTQVDRQRMSRLLADRQGFPTRLFCVGVLDGLQRLADVAALGCDAYVADPESAVDMIRAFVRTSASCAAVSANQLLRTMTKSTSAKTVAVGAGRRASRSVSVQQVRARAVGLARGSRGGARPPA